MPTIVNSVLLLFDFFFYQILESEWRIAEKEETIYLIFLDSTRFNHAWTFLKENIKIILFLQTIGVLLHVVQTWVHGFKRSHARMK